MKLEKIIGWIESVLEPGKFDDVSNNGLQIAREGDEIDKVAFAVDGSVRSVKAAAEAGAQLLVVHHGISWGGGIRRLVDGEYRVVKAAMDANLALAAYHLPLDANRRYGNNWELARYLGLTKVEPAFSYHGNVIGITGYNAHGRKIGVCSGGAGEFAAEARRLGCEVYVTGEASWGDRVAAENIGMKMVCAGHYETETFGVCALAKGMKRALRIATTFVSLMLCVNLFAAEGEEEASTGFYAGVSGTMALPQGGSRLHAVGGAAFRGGWYLSDAWALEGEVAVLEDVCGLAAEGLWHWKGWEEYDKLFGYSRFDPFFTIGVRGALPGGQVGPAVGVGALCYLTDEWALRFDANALLGLETRCEMVYAIALGVQYSF